MLEEYKLIRAEVLHSLNAGRNVVQIGFGLVSALFAGTFFLVAERKDGGPSGDLPVASVNYGVLIPCLCLIFLGLWLGEYRRLQRATRYLYLLEQKINMLIIRQLFSDLLFQIYSIAFGGS